MESDSSTKTTMIEAGAAVVDISPDSLKRRQVWMCGYKPNRYATEQAGPIEVRALALGGARSGLVIVVIDTCLISPRLANEWAAAISDAVPLPVSRVFVVTTHTHSGPDLSSLFGDIPREYKEKVRAGILDAAVCAWAAREPTEMYVGTGTHELGIPRRKKRGQRDWDKDLVILQWRSKEKVVATLINLACHGVVLPLTSRLLSGDLPAALCREADDAFGGVSLFVPRDQGDVNPDIPGKDPYKQDGNPEELARLACLGGKSIEKAVASARLTAASPVTVKSRNLSIRIINPWIHISNGPWWAGRWPTWPGRIPIKIKKFRIGDIEGMAVPGEVLNCLGRRMLEKMGDPALLFTYTGGYYGYLMTRKTYRRGGYEPSVSPGPVDPGRL